jgi:tRNA pseudouridine(55) synthase
MVEPSRPAGARARWREVDGIVLLDKPAAISSNHALQRVRRALQAAKAGHAGTLDPMATGMLPLCFGQATKACGQLLGSTKAYRATVTFGAATDTGDADGQVIGQSEVPPLAADAIDRVLAALVGNRAQVPPMYSALKRDGRPLYELARRGEEVERAARPIRIESLTRLAIDGAALEFDLVCSKGTYVRVLAEEIAAALGTLGHLSRLRRLWVDPFREDAMIALEAIERWAASGGWEHGPPPGLLGVDRAFPGLPKLDLDRFLALQGEPAAGAPAFQVAALSLRTPELVVGGKVFHDVQARATHTPPARWQVAVNAREVSGDVSYSSDGKGAVVARLKHLIHPESHAAAGAGQQTLESLPAIELTAESYVFHERALGRLEVRAVNERRGWRVDKLALVSPDCTFGAKGLWQPAAGAAAPRTSFAFDIEAADGGKCLARLGYPDTLTGTAARLEGEAEWHGPVYALDFPTLSGKLTLDAQKGQFMKVNPGIGKLLGVLSLQSLPRRISLDFRDVFSEGFAFDSIRGTAIIRAGVIRTEDLAMVGPAATVALRGEADLSRETQDLTVRVVPVIGDSVAAAAGVMLLNPIIGAGALLAQRLLKDPLGQIFAFEYRITGGWEEPKVERLAAPLAVSDTRAQPGSTQ